MAGKKTLQPLPIHPDHGLHTDYLCMMIPLIAWPTFLYGLRPLVVCLTAMVTARICDRIACWLRSRRFDPSENSSIAQALLLAMLMPASVPYYVVAVSVAFSVLLAKEAFGGYGAYPPPHGCGLCGGGGELAPVPVPLSHTVPGQAAFVGQPGEHQLFPGSFQRYAGRRCTQCHRYGPAAG